ncbi:unnamed protein product [Thlaspi arvense]|uniref:Uncharacterized protein n=1 Tax=Thlaspi arvense TaxID=13288 RepID=A0AAU9R8I1_THLAR|nr:unnamed protein product [Thlaspi arvense]
MDPFINLPSSSQIENQGLSRAFENRGGFATDSLNPSQRKYSVFLYNHDNATFTQLRALLLQALTRRSLRLTTI